MNRLVNRYSSRPASSRHSIFRRRTAAEGNEPQVLWRHRSTAGRFITAAELRAAPDKKLARAAGIVTHRQRPGTASGIVFVTMEDAHQH